MTSTPTVTPISKHKRRQSLLILLDGHALIHRSFHAIQRPLTVSTTGEDVRGVYGFVNAFLRTLGEWQPSHVAITFDLPTPTFRHKMFEQYKAHRPPTPPELKPQFDRVRQIMTAFKVPIYELEGFEADDLLGTLSKQAEDSDIDTLILTGDTDTLQLVSNRVRVLMNAGTQKRSLYDIEAVQGRYGGLGPEYVADIKALQGDSSDNIPGVPGIGVKTAIKLLTDYGSLDEIYKNVEGIKPPRAKTSLLEHRDLAYRSKKLTTIVRDAPAELDLKNAVFGGFERTSIVSLLRELEFHSILPRIPVDEEYNNTTHSEKTEDNQLPLFVSSQNENTEYTIVNSSDTLNQVITSISSRKGFSFDTETTSLDTMNCELVGISFSIEKAKAWYIPLGHNEGIQLPKEDVLKRLAPVFANPDIPKRAHNANFDLSVLQQNGILIDGLEFDSMIAAHVGGRRNYGLKELSLECFGIEMTSISELIGTGRHRITMAEVPIETAGDYAAADADFTERLYNLLKSELEQKEISDLYNNVEIPLIPILVQMQRNGVSLNSTFLKEMSTSLGTKLDSIQREIFQSIGHEFNLNSPKQLSDILFTELRLPTTKKTTLGFSTNAQSLDDIKNKLDRGDADASDPRSYDVLNHILAYREISKLKSTYVDALPEMVNTITNRLHTSYRQTGTATGRLSSNDPNLQNIPVRTELGRRVREAFISKKGSSLLAADYSQIELRVLAHFSHDPALMKAFENGEDIHNATSSLVYDVPIEQVDSHMRRIAKVLNFGVIYGLSPHGIARQTDLSQSDGKKFIDIYFNKYPGIQKYLDSVKTQCRIKGYVETILGRRRYLPDINARNFRLRSQAERAAINMPIQGTAADIINASVNYPQPKASERPSDALALPEPERKTVPMPPEFRSKLKALFQTA